MNYFDKYVSNYNIKKETVNYKYHHSYRVMKNMEVLATKLNLSEKDIKLAKVIGILHDIGRFEQDKLYNSFKDEKMDHGDYGVKVLKESNILRETGIDESEYHIIYKSIKNHNKFKIEDNLSERELLFTKLIRDADKLDILYALGNKTIKKILIQDNQNPTKEIENNFFNHQINNSLECKNKTDNLITIFCFIYDINFKITYQIIKQNKYYDKIYKRIKRKDIFKKYLDHTNKYIEERTE